MPELCLPNQLVICRIIRKTALRGMWAQCAVVKQPWKTAKWYLCQNPVFSLVSPVLLRATTDKSLISVCFNISICKTVTLEIITVAAEERALSKTWLSGRTGSTNSLCQFCVVVKVNSSITTPATGVCTSKQTNPQNWHNTSTKLEFVLAKSRRCSIQTCRNGGLYKWMKQHKVFFFFLAPDSEWDVSHKPTDNFYLFYISFLLTGHIVKCLITQSFIW